LTHHSIIDPETEEEALEAAEEAVSHAQPGKILVKALVLVAVTVLGVVLYRTTPLAEWLQPAGAVARWIADLGTLGVLASYVVMVVSVLVGVPRLLFCPIAGAVFGFWSGLALCIASSLTSYYAAFLFVRGRHSAGAPRRPLHPRLAFLENDLGFEEVVLARLIPLPGLVSTIALSLSRVGHGAYLLGSAIGLVPEAAPLVLLGTGTLHTDPAHLTRLAVVAVLFVVVPWMLMRHAMKRHRPASPGHHSTGSRTRPTPSATGRRDSGCP